MKVGKHLRSNAIAYLALFFALTGSAVALPNADTVFSDDIVDGQVKSQDISNESGVRSADVRNDTLPGGGLIARDLRADSVGNSELGFNAVGSTEIKADSVERSDLAVDSVGGDEIEGDAIGNTEIAADQVGGSEINSGVVGADELGDIHEHLSSPRNITDPTALDGLPGAGTAQVFCGTDEQLLSVSARWSDTNSRVEQAWVADVPQINRSGNDSVNVTAAFDGGGVASDPATFQAVATCIR